MSAAWLSPIPCWMFLRTSWSSLVGARDTVYSTGRSLTEDPPHRYFRHFPRNQRKVFLHAGGDSGTVEVIRAQTFGKTAERLLPTEVNMNRAARAAISSFLFVGLLVTGSPLLNSQDFSPQPSPYPNSGSNPRVFITDSQSWSMSGGFGGSSGGFGGGVRGGARPQRAEIIKTFGDRCKSVTVTLNQESADFVVLLDHEGGKGWAQKDNKIAVFNRVGDAIYSDSTRSLGNSVKGACQAIMASPVMAAPAPPPPPAAVAVPVNPTPVAPAQARTPNPATPPAPPAPPAMDPADSATCSVFVKSTPTGADITIDGKFVGSTPSNLKLPAGDHKINVGMSGYTAWERTITVMEGGSVTLDAKLQQD